jgi:hypothetical protein
LRKSFFWRFYKSHPIQAKPLPNEAIIIIITQESRDEEEKIEVLSWITLRSLQRKKKKVGKKEMIMSALEKRISPIMIVQTKGTFNHCSRASLAENVAARCSKNSKPLSAK